MRTLPYSLSLSLSQDLHRHREEAETLARKRPTINEAGKTRLLFLFEPLICRCSKRATLMLPDEDQAVLRAEVRYGFLLLLSEFDHEQGVPFAGYIKSKLHYHTFNWCRLEQKRLWGETAWEEESFDTQVCAAWMNRDTYLNGGVGEWLKDEVDKLPASQRLVMQGVAEGLTERQIGALLGISGVGVHQLKAAAKKTLIKKFAKFSETT